MLQAMRLELIKMCSHGPYCIIELGTLLVIVLGDSSWLDAYLCRYITGLEQGIKGQNCSERLWTK